MIVKTAVVKMAVIEMMNRLTLKLPNWHGCRDRWVNRYSTGARSKRCSVSGPPWVVHLDRMRSAADRVSVTTNASSTTATSSAATLSSGWKDCAAQEAEAIIESRAA